MINKYKFEKPRDISSYAKNITLYKSNNVTNSVKPFKNPLSFSTAYSSTLSDKSLLIPGSSDLVKNSKMPHATSDAAVLVIRAILNVLVMEASL